MTTLLAVDTSGPLCSLAIFASGRWFEDTQNVERLHNQVVLENLEALVRSAGIERDDFDAVAFGAGPGSFTGIRIAAAVCQGVALACDARTVAVSSSRALAVAARNASGTAGTMNPILTVTRSRRDAYYLAGYQVTGDAAPVQLFPDRLQHGAEPPGDLRDHHWVGVGDRPPWWHDDYRFLDGVAVTARIVGELALDAMDGGEGGAPEAALPRYVPGDSPWKPARR